MRRRFFFSGHITILTNEDGSCKTENCPYIQIGKHPSRSTPPQLGKLIFDYIKLIDLN